MGTVKTNKEQQIEELYRKKFIFRQLSWKILECKYLYYISANSVEDEVYDYIEDIYKKLAKELNENTTASDMVGFDVNRPSCMMVKSKITTLGENIAKNMIIEYFHMLKYLEEEL